MKLTIDNMGNVFDKDTSLGNLVDAVRNFPTMAADIKAVFDMYLLDLYNNYTTQLEELGGKYKKELDDEKSKYSNDLKETLAQAQQVEQGLADKLQAVVKETDLVKIELRNLANASIQTVVAEANSTVEAVKQENARLVALINVLGTKEEAQAMMRAQRTAQLKAELEALEGK